MKFDVTNKINLFIYRFKYRYAKNLPLSVPVDVSLELASECNQRCGYCLDPKTKVLKHDLTWTTLDQIKENDQIISFDEEIPDGTYTRKMRIGVVEKKWNTKKEAIEIITDNGSVKCSLDHRFLDISSRWTFAKNFKVGQEIKFAEDPWQSAEMDLDYMRGYLTSMTEGDGTARWLPIDGITKGTDPRRQTWWRVALKDKEPLHRCISFLKEIGIETTGIKLFSEEHDNYARIEKVEFRSKGDLQKLYNFLYNEAPSNTNSYKLGYLAGIFDSEGCFSKSLRISQKQDNDILDRTESYMKDFGFDCVREEHGVRLLGGLWENIKFLGTIRACILRKINSFEGSRISHRPAIIKKIVRLGEIDLIDIQTSTKTFYGAGFPTHNCYHADQDRLPFTKGVMKYEIAEKIVLEAAELGVNSLKFNYKGESTINPHFSKITSLAKYHASGSTFIDRITNSNFKFMTNREDIFEGLCNQTKVKISFDSFIASVMETQRKGSVHRLALANIDKFYNHPKRKNTEIVIQAVRTKLNKDEDIAGETRRRWPEATVSIRDMVGGRVDKDLSGLEDRTRDVENRISCIQAHARIIFNFDGTAQMCCPDIGGKLIIGNIQTDTVYEIFNSDKAREIRKSLKDKTAFKLDPCKTCSSFESYKGFSASWTS